MEKNLTINAILACDTEYGIGKNNALPWPRSNDDMKWFRENTIHHVVVMGRKTWMSLENKALTDRINVVITNSPEILEGSPDMISYGDMGKLLQTIEMSYPNKIVWVIGGAEIYDQALPYCHNLYLTKFKQRYDCNKFINKELITPFTTLLDSKSTDECTFSVWSRG
jgi:dihydrofolate reductase